MGHAVPRQVLSPLLQRSTHTARQKTFHCYCYYWVVAPEAGVGWNAINSIQIGEVVSTYGRWAGSIVVPHPLYTIVWVVTAGGVWHLAQSYSGIHVPVPVWLGQDPFVKCNEGRAPQVQT